MTNSRNRNHRILAREWIASLEKFVRGWKLVLAPGWEFCTPGHPRERYYSDTYTAYAQSHRRYVRRI